MAGGDIGWNDRNCDEEDCSLREHFRNRPGFTAGYGIPRATHSSDTLTFPNLEIRINEQTVYHNGIPVPLTHHEFFTLRYMAEHPSWVLSKEQIYEAVWKANPEHCGAAVANVVYSLRRKIGEGYIETVVGSGYRFVG